MKKRAAVAALVLVLCALVALGIFWRKNPAPVSEPVRSAEPAALAERSVLQPQPSAESLSDALRAPRPEGGEYLGLYLLGKKVGYVYFHLEVNPQNRDQARSIQEAMFKVNVGGRMSERYRREIRTYEAMPRGRLLSFLIESKGDGGDQLLEGTASPSEIKVLRKRPGRDTETLNLPATDERIEDSDPARVAILRGAPLEGMTLDGDDLHQYKVSTTLGKPESRLLGGAPVKLQATVTVSEKEKIPIQTFISDKGAIVEMSFGQNMVGRAEPEDVAKRIDRAEVFGLTRVVLPKPLPKSAKTVPGAATLTVTGLPERFFRESNRQTFRKLDGGQVEVKIRAFPPSRSVSRPLEDPAGGTNLKATLAVESNDPKISAMARRIAGDETDAYKASQRVADWVSKNMVKDYGASSDRATDVLSQMRGDCTEHSLLAVALLRALGIPAKRVDGLVYLVQGDGVPAYYWHEWVEAYVGEWTQLDPTFGQPVADAAHLALGEEGNAEIVALIGQLKVIDVR